MYEYFEIPARDYYDRRTKWSGFTGLYANPPSDAFDEAEELAGEKVRFAYWNRRNPVFKIKK